MSGEGLTTSFRRTQETKKSNQELLQEFQKIIHSSRAMKHMKWYGQAESVQLIEHGDEELPKFQQEYVAIKDTFEFYISVRESWYQDADLYESHEVEDSFVSLARKFANDNALMYFPDGFPAEWIETETTDGEKCWNHFKVKPDDKNIDKICDVWYRYGIMKLQAFDEKVESELWCEARDKIKQLMEYEYIQ
tara:strand:- start:85 stop:660 length:576 start_codon:yes stop_codon:yes gene_type:complete